MSRRLTSVKTVDVADLLEMEAKLGAANDEREKILAQIEVLL